MLWNTIEEMISKATDKAFSIRNRKALGGGCINEVYCIEGSSTSFCVKTNVAEKHSMFQAEFEALKEILASKTIPVPSPYMPWYYK